MLNKKALLAASALITLTSCGTLPTSGPYSKNIKSGASFFIEQESEQESADLEKNEFNYIFIDLLKLNHPDVFVKRQYLETYDWPKNTVNKRINIGVGDSLEITIYEIDSGGLFIPTEAGTRPGNFVTLPRQVIDKSGKIQIPFIGEIKAAGRSANSIAAEIQKKLGNRAKDPQVIVNIVERNGSEVNVLGAVNSPKRFPLNLNGERITDAIARAEGPSSSGHEIFVTLQRGSNEWTIPFEAILEDHENNIYLYPQDTLYLFREPKMFQIFGAANFEGAIPFIKRKITLSEAIGQARGIADNFADPSEIYVYRNEPVEFLSSTQIDYEKTHKDIDLSQKTLPVIYRINLREPEGFFMAKSFEIQNEDIVYIANAESVEFIKFLRLLSTTAGTKINVQEAIDSDTVFVNDNN